MSTTTERNAPSGRPDVRPRSKELQAIARQFKQGFRYRRGGGGHFVVVDRNGNDVLYRDRPLTVGGDPSPTSLRKHLAQLADAQVLKGTEPRAIDDALRQRRIEKIREVAAEHSQQRQAETTALRERYLAVFKNIGQGLQVPGLAGDLGKVAAYLVRGTPEGMTMTPDLLVGSAHRSLVNGAPADRRYLDVWRMLVERLEEATDTVGEWFNLVREARGLPTDTVNLRMQEGSQDEWPFRVELLPLSSLLVDDTYQRPPGWGFVRREAARFDASLVGTIDVAQRSPSSFAILDGQQRTEIVRLVGKATIWASIYIGLDVQSEARFFLHKNAHRKNMHPFYTFRAEVASGDPDANAVEAIVAKHGYKLAIGAPRLDANVNHIAAIAAVKKAHERKLPDGRDALDPTLEILSRATFGRVEGQSAMMIRGLSATLVERPDFELERMVDVVAFLGPDLILGRMRDVKRATPALTSEQAIARVVLGEYDSRRRARRRAA